MSVKEYTRDFEKLLIKCDLQEGEDQTIVRYLGGLDLRYSNVVELQQYSTFNDVYLIDHRVKQKKNAKPFKKDPPKLPLTRNPFFNEGSFQPLSKPMASTSIPPPQNKTPTQFQFKQEVLQVSRPRPYSLRVYKPKGDHLG